MLPVWQVQIDLTGAAMNQARHRHFGGVLPIDWVNDNVAGNGQKPLIKLEAVTCIRV